MYFSLLHRNSLIDEYAVDSVAITLIGNKCDLEKERKVSAIEAENLADELGIDYAETSAVTNDGIKKAIKIMCSDIVRRTKSPHIFLKRDADSDED